MPSMRLAVRRYKGTAQQYANRSRERVRFEPSSGLSRRVGVPGGRYLQPKRTCFELLCTFRGSAIKLALTDASTYLHLAWLAASCVIGYFWSKDCVDQYFRQVRAYYGDNTTGSPEPGALSEPPDPEDWLLPDEVMDPLTFMVNFGLTSFVGYVLRRYHERWNFHMKCCGARITLTMLAASALPANSDEALLLMRYSSLVWQLVTMGLNGDLTAEDWRLLQSRGLIIDRECAFLKQVEGSRAHQVNVWAYRLIYRLQGAGKLTEFQANELKQHVEQVRHGAKQVAYHLTNTPKPYYDFTSWSVHVYLVSLSWNAGVRFANAYQAYTPLQEGMQAEAPFTVIPLLLYPIGQLGLILLYNSLRVFAVSVLEPFGDDETDYELDHDLRAIWKDSLDVVSGMRLMKKQVGDGEATPTTSDVADEMIDAALQ